jgi:hypothetical protein
MKNFKFNLNKKLMKGLEIFLLIFVILTFILSSIALGLASYSYSQINYQLQSGQGSIRVKFINGVRVA